MLLTRMTSVALMHYATQWHYATHQDDLSGSGDTEDDGEMEDSATDGGEVEPSVRPRHPHSDSHSPDSP